MLIHIHFVPKTLQISHLPSDKMGIILAKKSTTTTKKIAFNVIGLSQFKNA